MNLALQFIRLTFIEASSEMVPKSGCQEATLEEMKWGEKPEGCQITQGQGWKSAATSLTAWWIQVWNFWLKLSLVQIYDIECLQPSVKHDAAAFQPLLSSKLMELWRQKSSIRAWASMQYHPEYVWEATIYFFSTTVIPNTPPVQ